LKDFKGNFTPGCLGNQWRVSLPFGRGIKAILLDLIIALKRQWLCKTIDPLLLWYDIMPWFKDRGERLFKTLSEYHVTFLSVLKDNKESIEKFVSDHPRVKNLNRESFARLAYFNDTGGKKRYIAIGN
jgi:hypothetical protein